MSWFEDAHTKKKEKMELPQQQESPLDDPQLLRLVSRVPCIHDPAMLAMMERVCRGWYRSLVGCDGDNKDPLDPEASAARLCRRMTAKNTHASGVVPLCVAAIRAGHYGLARWSRKVYGHAVGSNAHAEACRRGWKEGALELERQGCVVAVRSFYAVAETQDMEELDRLRRLIKPKGNVIYKALHRAARRGNRVAFDHLLDLYGGNGSINFSDLRAELLGKAMRTSDMTFVQHVCGRVYDGRYAHRPENDIRDDLFRWARLTNDRWAMVCLVAAALKNNEFDDTARTTAALLIDAIHDIKHPALLFEAAVKADNLAAITWLYDKFRRSPHITNILNSVYLSVARSGKVHMLKHLCELDGGAYRRTEDWWWVHRAACKSGHKETIEYARGSDERAYDFVAMYAIEHNDLASLQRWGERCEPLRDFNRFSIRAARYGRLAMLQWAYEKGWRPNEKDIAIAAAMNADLEMVRWLLSVTGNMYVQTVYSIASSQGYRYMAVWLERTFSLLRSKKATTTTTTTIAIK